MCDCNECYLVTGNKWIVHPLFHFGNKRRPEPFGSMQNFIEAMQSCFPLASVNIPNNSAVILNFPYSMKFREIVTNLGQYYDWIVIDVLDWWNFIINFSCINHIYSDISIIVNKYQMFIFQLMCCLQLFHNLTHNNLERAVAKGDKRRSGNPKVPGSNPVDRMDFDNKDGHSHLSEEM